MQEKKEEDLQQALNKAFEVGIDEGPSIINSDGFSFNFFKALIIESSVATLIPNSSISLAEDCPIP